MGIEEVLTKGTSILTFEDGFTFSFNDDRDYK